MNIWKEKYCITILVKDDVKNSFYKIPECVNCDSLNVPLVLDMKNRRQRIKAVCRNTINSHVKLKQYLHSHKFDYIYTTTPLNSLEVYLANSSCAKRMVISEHASAYAMNWIYRLIKRFVYPRVFCISVPNKMDCDVYKAWKCRTVYIPHLFTFSADVKNSLNTRVALNVGRYTADKRQEELIKIWDSVRNRSNWKLWIVGKGEEEDNLKKIISKMGLQESVKLVEYTPEISEIYKQASLFLFSSKMEGFGMVLLEAMAFGIPCISYDCPSGPRDIIKDGYNGYLVSDNDSLAFKERLEKMIDNEDLLLRKMGDNAFDTVRRWSNKAIADRWDKVYSLIDKGKR